MTKTLLLHVGYSVRASYYDDWLDAFSAHPALRCEAINLFARPERKRLRAALATAELVVVLHSGTADSLDFVEDAATVLQTRRGPLVAFIGNEFNAPWLPISRKRAWLKSVGADFVATQLLRETGEWLYEGGGAQVISLPHALNPDAFRWTTPRAGRPIDIGSRSFPYPVYLGDDTRNRLHEAIAPAARRLGYRVDIRLDQRMARREWAAFLNNCRFTIASESGSPYLERDDATAHAIRKHLAKKRRGVAIAPDGPLRNLAKRVPWTLRERLYRLLKAVNVTHEGIERAPELRGEIERLFFSGRDPSPHYGLCVSSRQWDAIGCGVVQILVEGRYNDLLEAGTHYLPVRRDLSDLDAVLERTRDAAAVDRIAEAAYEHARSRHTHRHRIDALLARIAAGHERPDPASSPVRADR